MALTGLEIYVSKRNVRFISWQEVDGAVKYVSEPYRSTLQMNRYGYITHPRGAAWCKDTGIVEHGYRKFALDPVKQGISTVVFVLWVEEEAYQELNERRRQMFNKECK